MFFKLSRWLMGESKSSQMLLFSLTGRHDPAHWFMAGLLCETIVRLESACVCVHKGARECVSAHTFMLDCMSLYGCLLVHVHVNPKVHGGEEGGRSVWWVHVSTEAPSEFSSSAPRLLRRQNTDTNQRGSTENFFILRFHDWTSTTRSMSPPAWMKGLSRNT